MLSRCVFIFFFFIYLFIILFISVFYLYFINTFFKFFYIYTFSFIIELLLLFWFLLLISLYLFLYQSYWQQNYYIFFFIVNFSHFSYFSYFSYFFFPFIYILILITLFTLFYCIGYNINEFFSFCIYISIIFFSGFGIFFSFSFFSLFFFYEVLLIPSFLILFNFAKTRKCIEAAYLMFFWTQFGAVFLFFSFIYLFFITSSPYFFNLTYFSFTYFQSFVISFFFFLGFGVKFPIWPFYEWLPKAHVEASTNFSIFLSGVLVKFAFFCFYKCLIYLDLFLNLLIFYIFLIIGLFDAVFKLYFQIDLKKLIAYSTVIEMHWLTFTLFNGQSILWIVSFSMLISHAFLSSNFFYLIDLVTRRLKTRLITEISGLNLILPNLYIISVILLITFLGFPGSFFFISEFLFFSFLLDVNFIFTLFLLFLLYFFASSCFFKNWFFLLFGYSYYYTNIKLISDLDFKESIIFFFFIFFLYLLGFSNQFFF